MPDFFFFYRLAIYATLSFTTSLQAQYCIQWCVLVAMLFIHSVLQPYSDKYKYTNIIDAVIFLNLNCINALSVYNYYGVIDIQGESDVAFAIQLILVYLPLFYIPIHFFWWFRVTCCNSKDVERSPLLRPQPVVDPEGDRERLIELFQDSVNLNEYDVIDDQI